jgi:ATP-binding protein involved in chromosome partitioning
MLNNIRLLLSHQVLRQQSQPRVLKRNIFGKIFSKNEGAVQASAATPKPQPNLHQNPFTPPSHSNVTGGAYPAPSINTNIRPGTGHMKQPVQNKSNIPGVKNVIAVASGKGGVGKSTVAVNLALAFERLGKRVGLLDADIYGPSIPLMMNLRNQQPEILPDNFMKPLTNYNVKCISSGFLVPEDTAYVWRGPMIMGAVQQLLFQVQWGELDILVLDLPPGTGDTQLTVTQRVALSGAVIVSTPQDVALADARRGITMFKNVNVPILGVIENMSGFVCPKCSEVHDIFGKGGAKQTAVNMGIDFLGEIPLDPAIRDTIDHGKPIVVSNPECYSSQLYIEMAKKLLEKLDKGDKKPKGPAIVFE